MPRKDGTPTAAERLKAERLAANEVFITQATDEQLREVLGWNSDADIVAQIKAEIARREVTP